MHAPPPSLQGLLAAAVLLVAPAPGAPDARDAVRAAERGGEVVVVDPAAREALLVPDGGERRSPRLVGDERGRWVVTGVARRSVRPELEELDQRTRAALVLRETLRLPLLPTGPPPRVAVRPSAEGAPDPVDAGTDAAAGAAASWHRCDERRADLWWPVQGGGDADGAVVALTPAFTADAEALAAYLVGLELLASHDRGLSARLLAANGGPDAPAAPGELWGRSRDEVEALCERVRAAIFSSERVAAATASVGAGAELVVTGLDGPRLAELLFSGERRPRLLAAAVRELTPERFHELHRELWDPARLVVVTLRSEPPKGGGYDLSKSARANGDEEGRALGERLVARLGGAEAWTSSRALVVEASTSTTTQLAEQVADSVTLRVLPELLTRVSQEVEFQGSVLASTITVHGSRAWITTGARLMEPDGEQLARVLAGERRSLVRLVAGLAGGETVGARRLADGRLELFDAHAVLGRLELAEDGAPVAFEYDEPSGTRRFEYEAPVEFGALRYPAASREVGGRQVRVVFTALRPVDEVDRAAFADPRR